MQILLQLLPHPQQQQQKTSQEPDDRVVLYPDTTSSSRRGWKRVPLSTLIDELGYREAEIARLEPEVLDLIVQDGIRKPRSGVPPRWMRNSAATNEEEDVIRIVSATQLALEAPPKLQQQYVAEAAANATKEAIPSTKETEATKITSRVEKSKSATAVPSASSSDPVVTRDTTTATAAATSRPPAAPAAAAAEPRRQSRSEVDEDLVNGNTKKPESRDSPPTSSSSSNRARAVLLREQEAPLPMSSRDTERRPRSSSPASSQPWSGDNGKLDEDETRGRNGTPPPPRTRKSVPKQTPVASSSERSPRERRRAAQEQRSGGPRRVYNGRSTASASSSARRKRKLGLVDADDTDDPPRASRLWPDMNTFRGLLRNEAQMRLRILGDDYSDMVKNEADWRTDLYKNWLWTLHRGVGEPFVQSRSERARRQRPQPPPDSSSSRRRKRPSPTKRRVRDRL